MKNKILYLVLALLFFNSPSNAATQVGKIVALTGSVDVQRGKKSIELKLNDKLFSNDVIKTRANSLVLLFMSDGSTHKMGEKSSLKLNPPKDSTLLEVLSGSLFSLFKPGKDREGKRKHFRIKTKSAVVGVRGTQFFTSYGSSKKPSDNWLCVKEGLVDVQMLGDSKKVIVKAGEGVAIQEKSGVSAPKPLSWTEKLNWDMNPESKDLVNKVDIESAYTDLLDQDYD